MEIVRVAGPSRGGVARLRLCPTGCFSSATVWAYSAPEGVGAMSTQHVRPFEAGPHRLAWGSAAR